MVELTEDDLKMFSDFERITHVLPSDYISTESSVIFLVEMPLLGKAIGKQASNIEKLRKVFRKRVIIVGDNSDPEIFLRSFFGNITVHSVEFRDIMDEKAMILTVEEKDRGIAIGRSGERIKAAKALLKKKFDATLHLRTRRTAF
ncbi:MAG: NusA-like transcription termination signal-binding factor [Candidatus Micrarchaeota archaeon]